MSLTKHSYPLDVNQRPHQTTQYKFMMHYVKSGDKRRRGQLEHLAQKNAGTKSKHLRKLPLKQYWCVCVTTHLLLSVAYPGILFVGGGVEHPQLRTENWYLGAVAP